ncbi:MAG: sigma-54-dependent Fis family transcriptional regulator [Hyphomicrobiales bacterium]|nr:sigma-54-dependent Fis family transcriptional regulator [Hyphomicrobiales bacterium]
MSLDILIVDDESDIRDLVSDILKDEGYSPRTAKDSVSAFEAIAKRIPNAILLDIWLEDSELDGLGVLELVKQRYPEVPVIMMSGHGNIETAVNSILMGAYDYIEKPFKAERLLVVLKRAIEAARLKSENSMLRSRYHNRFQLIGNNPSIIQLRQSISRVAPTGSRVFITGPAGAGKEVVGRIIHEKSRRCHGPFVVFSTASMTSEMVDQELFGIEDDKGIGSLPKKIGVFEKANNGTLFVDEVTDIPVSVQGKFVRVLQDKTLTRLGGSRPIEVNVRVIAATSYDVSDAIARGLLREDLYYRLNVVPIKVPPLKDRREDIPMLSDYFLKFFAEQNGQPVRKLSEDAIAAMQAYEWPGNVRQLRNMIEWLLIMAPDSHEPINSAMLPKEIFSTGPSTLSPELNTDIMSIPLREAREIFERQYLTAQISRFGGNISRTSAFIGMERSALHRKLKSLSIRTEKLEVS